jgi:protein involved in polysaccharide export with SLBB domain
MTSEINSTLNASTLFLVPGDSLDVQFASFADWNHQTKVRPDGHATFKSIGDLSVAGMSLEDLSKKLREAYAGIGLTDPDLTVSAHDIAPRTVIVQGEVHRPGEVPLAGDHLTLVEAIGRAGGPLKETAYLENTLLVRWIPQEKKQRAWKIDARTDYWPEPVPIFLQPYDVIYIPNTPIDRVDIFVDQYIRRLIPLPLFIPVPVR